MTRSGLKNYYARWLARRRCSESSCTESTLRFLRSGDTQPVFARYVFKTTSAHISRTYRFAAFVAFIALFISTGAQAAQVRVWLDRASMQLGETVTLNIEVSDDASAAQPDFNALQQDFKLLGTQSSTSMNIINGQATSKQLWAVGLEPKRAGTFTIPALSVAGTQTQALSLVVQPGGTSTGKAGDDVFLDVDTQPLSPYVQQQVRVTVKLFYALNLTDGNLEDP